YAIAKGDVARPAIRGHLAVLFGSTVLLYGVQLWLRRYEYGLMDSGQFMGAGYAAIHQLGIQGVIAWMLIISGALAILSALVPGSESVNRKSEIGNRKSSLPSTLAITGLVLSVILYLGGILAYPAILQVAVVN